MQIYKFGGASIKDAEGVRNIARIITKTKDDPLVVILSATQYTTNDLEKIVDAYFHRRVDLNVIFEKVKSRHEEMMFDLFPNTNHSIFDEVANTLSGSPASDSGISTA